MDLETKSTKRKLEPDDDYGEEEDTFDTDGASAPRRGRKEGRRISGVYREIKALEKIGKNATVVELVMEKLSLKEVMRAGSMNSMWYITAMHTLRKRYGDRPILRLWNSQKPTKYLWIEWLLHFHEQLLAGMEEEDCSKKVSNVKYSSIDTIISIATTRTFDQFIHEDAKLPFRQDHIYLTSGHAIFTTPDFEYTGTVDDKFGWSSMMVQSFFIPRSEHVSFKVFALESAKESWPLDLIKNRVEFIPDDVKAGQQLRAVLCVNYTSNGPTLSFTENFRSHYKSVALLSGYAEEIGCNRIMVSMNESPTPLAVGLSIYAGSGANVSVYEVDFEQDSSSAVLLKMEEQARGYRHGFCFVFSHDSRQNTPIVDTVEEDWPESETVRPPSKVAEILKEMRKRLPRTPIFGVDSFPSITAETLDKSNSNVQGDSERRLCWGILLVTYG